jgi:hypothetical protein
VNLVWKCVCVVAKSEGIGRMTLVPSPVLFLLGSAMTQTPQGRLSVAQGGVLGLSFLREQGLWVLTQTLELPDRRSVLPHRSLSTRHASTGP